MLFDPLELRALQSQLLQKYTEQDYCDGAVDGIIAMVKSRPRSWEHFGPYWPVVQDLILKYRPGETRHAQEWGDPPDYLAHYDYGEDMLNAIAALQYLNRDGEYLAPIGHPHSIQLENGDNALYSPALGLIET